MTRPFSKLKPNCIRVCYCRDMKRTSTIQAPLLTICPIGDGGDVFVLRQSKNLLLHVPVSSVLWFQTSNVKMDRVKSNPSVDYQ